MSAVDTTFYEKKKSQTFYVALVLFVFVIATTGGLYVYNYNLEQAIASNTDELSQLETSIGEIQSDEKVQIYSIYAQNKNLFSQLATGSNIPSMVNHLKRVFAIQGITYNGFSYSDGLVTTELSIETNDIGYAFDKATKFLKDYRENTEALFDIEQISSFTGYDRMNFTSEFILKK